MKKHWKKLVTALVVVVLAGAGASWWVARSHDAPPAFTIDDGKELLATTTAPDQPATSQAAGGTVTTVAGAIAAGVEGEWVIADGSEVGYRVDESINGFDTTANGRTQAVTGSFTIGATTVSAGSFTVDMTTFKSDESRRDGQFNGRIMDVANFPTSTFVLTSPIDFKQVPTDGSTINSTATGSLTLKGVTKPVTFEVDATFLNGRVAVVGQIPVIFADFGIENPSFGTITTEDNGLLEFKLAFDRA